MAAAKATTKFLYLWKKLKKGEGGNLEHSEKKSSKGLRRLISRSTYSRMRRWRNFMSISFLLLTFPPVDRKVWTLPRSSHWFDMAVKEFTEKEWRDNFRLSKDTFMYIVSMIEDEVSCKDT